MSVILLFFVLILSIVQQITSDAIIDSVNGTFRSYNRCNSNCGENLYYTRIINGTMVKSFEYPWIAAIFYKGQFLCGGSLINNLYVLSAAHCASGTENDYKIFFGITNIAKQNLQRTQIYEVQKIIKHKFNWQTFKNDIVLFKLSQKIRKFSDQIRPIQLPIYESEKYNYRKGIAAGWGTNNPTKRTNLKNLYEVKLPIISNKKCENLYSDIKDIHQSQICTLYSGDTPQDACSGDSGSPLMYLRDDYYELIGIVSWGHGCAEINYPGIYTRVTSYLKWIYNNTLDACRCEPNF